MKKQRRKHSAAFRAKIALKALKGMNTVNEIAARSEVHPAQVATWKRICLSRYRALHTIIQNKSHQFNG